LLAKGVTMGGDTFTCLQSVPQTLQSTFTVLAMGLTLSGNTFTYVQKNPLPTAFGGVLPLNLRVKGKSYKYNH